MRLKSGLSAVGAASGVAVAGVAAVAVAVVAVAAVAVAAAAEIVATAGELILHRVRSMPSGAPSSVRGLVPETKDNGGHAA
jgi:hypothetical protein